MAGTKHITLRALECYIDVTWWQRRILAPAFNSGALKEMYPIFVQKAEELRDRWDKIIGMPSSCIPYPTPPSTPPPDERKNDTSTKETPSGSVVDACDWMNRVTLDVIGLAGFGYRFDSLINRGEVVCAAFREMFQAAEELPGFKELFALWFPILEVILVRWRRMISCQSDG